MLVKKIIPTLKRVLPISIKLRLMKLLNRLKHLTTSLLVENNVEFSKTTAAGKPGDGINIWWYELEKIANRKIFEPISAETRLACTSIKKSYRPILQQYKIDFEEFFYGSIKDEEAEALYQLVRQRRPKAAYQIGTFVGYSALIIAHALRENGGGMLIAVDPEIPHRTLFNPVEVAKRAAKQMGLEQQVQFVRGWHSIASGDYVAKALKRSIPVVGKDVLDKLEGGIDFAFIDGDHSSSCTMADFLLLKDYLNINGVTVFHDVYSWPTVAQALHIMWHDIHYYVRGTSAYFGFDLRRGFDGLAAMERIADELFPMMEINIFESVSKTPVPHALVEIPSIKFKATTGSDGNLYVFQDVVSDMALVVSYPGFISYQGILGKNTLGDFNSVDCYLSRDVS